MSIEAESDPKQRLHKPAGNGRWELPEVGLMGTGLHPITTAECVDYMLDELDAGRGGWLLGSNLEHLRCVRRDANYKAMYASANLRVPGGASLGWACKLQRTPLPACVSSAHLLYDLAREACKAGRRIFLIGSTDELVQAASLILRERFEGLQIVGLGSILRTTQEDDLIGFARIGRAIQKADPELIFVGLDSPFQERLIELLRRDCPQAWWVGFGNEIKRVGLQQRSSEDWLFSMGLDWIRRLPSEPRRMLTRHLIYGVPALAGMLGRCFLRGMLPMAVTATRYGRRRPRALLIDDDKHALAHLELLLSSRFPALDVHTRTEPDATGGYEFYFIDNDFNGKRLATALAAHIRKARPQSMIFAFSGALDIETLKGLINVGCDGVCDKADPSSWKAILELVDARLKRMIERQYEDKHAFGGIRGSALSIQRLLNQWNQAIPTTKPKGDLSDG